MGELRTQRESRARELTAAKRWPLWQLRPAAFSFILFADFLALVVTAYSLTTDHASVANYVRVAAIAAAAIAYGEACDRIERLRRYLGDNGVRSNHLSIWAIAALLVAPAGLACAAVLVTYAHIYVMGRRHQSIRPHRMIFTGAAMVLATWTASQSAELLFGSQTDNGSVASAAGTVLAVCVYFFVDMAIIAYGVRLATRNGGIRQMLSDRDATLFELGTIMLGVVTAQLLVRSAWLAPASVACLVALHRASLVKQFQVAAVTDQKTGLLNAAAWRERANDVVRRAVREQQRVALIVIDLDHFKRVNDSHGHLVGDQVLRAVGDLLKRESRSHDLVGRFGGEEFLILIDGRTAAAHAVDIATRLRARIAELEFPQADLRVTASLGVAHQVPSEADLDALVSAADAALYEAKAGGRDRVHAVVAG